MGGHGDQTGQFIAAWVAGRIPHVGEGGFGPLYASIGWMNDDGSRLLGGAVYHNYVPAYRSIEISCVSEVSFTRAVIAGVMAYPFRQLKVDRVQAVTPKSSASARKFLEKFGFKREGSHRKAYGDFGDAISYGLLRTDWEGGWLTQGRKRDIARS